MGKRDLKKQYKEFDFSVIDFLSRLDTTDNNKLTPFLMKMFVEKIEEDKHSLKKPSLGGSVSPSERILQPSNMWERVLKNVITDVFISNENIDVLDRFATHLAENRIDDSDINNYNSWDDISKAVSKAEVKYLEKELAKQVEIVYQDDTWLFLKPLSLKASQVYGMGTKWCTSMKHNPDYFYKYSHEGILVYTINKKTGRKFGFFSSPKEFSVWDTVDRRVDSLETRIPTELLAIIRDSLDLEKHGTNETKFSKEELEEREKYRPQKMMAVGAIAVLDNDMGEDMEMAEEVMEEYADDEMLMEETYGEEAPDDGFIEARNEIVREESDEEWVPRSADYAFNGGDFMAPQEAMEAEPMMVTENEVMTAPANVPLEVVEDYGEDTVGYDPS